MKRLVWCIAAVMLAGVVTASADGRRIDISVKVDSEPVEFEDQLPVMVNERVLIPVRNMCEALGCDVAWDSVNQTVTITKDDITEIFTIGEANMSLGRGGAFETVRLDTEPVIFNGRTCMPARAAAEGLGAEVVWNAEEYTVEIFTGGGND